MMCISCADLLSTAIFVCRVAVAHMAQIRCVMSWPLAMAWTLLLMLSYWWISFIARQGFGEKSCHISVYFDALCICCVVVSVSCSLWLSTSCQPCHTPWSWCNSRKQMSVRFSQAPVQMLQQAADLLKPGGLIYATHWRPAWWPFDSEFGVKILKQKSCHHLSLL